MKFPIQPPDKTPQNLLQSVKKAVSKFELPETQFERAVRDKSPVKPTWSEKNTVLSTFLGSSLNFFKPGKSTAKFATVCEKTGANVWTVRNTV